MDKNFKEEIKSERNKIFGVGEVATNKIFNKLLEYYKSIILKAPKTIMDYSIDIALCNVNGYNKLGSIENIYKNWGDIFFIDFNNSAFMENEINEDGNICIGEGINFSDISNIQEIKNIQFSLSELINLCKEYNFKIRLYARNDYDCITAVEINIYESYEDIDLISIYMESIQR